MLHVLITIFTLKWVIFTGLCCMLFDCLWRTEKNGRTQSVVRVRVRSVCSLDPSCHRSFALFTIYKHTKRPKEGAGVEREAVNNRIDGSQGKQPDTPSPVLKPLCCLNMLKARTFVITHSASSCLIACFEVLFVFSVRHV
jgi:hypothetical protein